MNAKQRRKAKRKNGRRVGPWWIPIVNDFRGDTKPIELRTGWRPFYGITTKPGFRLTGLHLTEGV